MHALRHRSGRLRALTAAAAGLAAAVSLATPAVAAGGAATSQRNAGDWLARQINAQGVVHNGQYDYDDYGLTIDVATALRDLGGHGDVVKRADKALKAHVADYTTFGGVAYANSVAKLAAYAGRSGYKPGSFGGVNLLGQLKSSVATAAPIAGRIQDTASESADYANVIGQSFAVEALERADAAQADSALTFLLDQQCDNGAFRVYFEDDKTAEQQGCVDGAAGSEPDVDATAFAVLALSTVQGHDEQVAPALYAARSWLAGVQKSGGGFGSDDGTGAANSNSTGLAAQALVALGSCDKASRAASWIKGRQVSASNAGAKLAKQLGAIALDQAAFKAGKTKGITNAVTRDQWRRASAQAAPALLALQAGACRS